MSNTPDALAAEVDRLKLQLQSLQAKTGVVETTVGGYLLERLAQLGVRVRTALIPFTSSNAQINVMYFGFTRLCLASQEIST
jgi:hypothetical protein